MRRLHWLPALCVIAIAAAWTSSKLAERLGTRLGVTLDRSLGGAWRAALVEAEPEQAAIAPERAAAPNTLDAPPSRGEAAAPRVTRSQRARRPAAPAPQQGVRISSATVLRLARSGAQPSGTLVAASGGCPAGLRLSGVGALGIGLRDGDVLTHAGGRSATSRADVVGVVLAARGAHQREIGGRFCRAGELYNLIVDQPYLE